jgi:hypothetical protein
MGHDTVFPQCTHDIKDRFTNVTRKCNLIATFAPSLCTIHKGDSTERLDPVLTHQQRRQEIAEAHAQTVAEARARNAENNTSGSVTMGKAHPMLPIPLVQGYLDVAVTLAQPKQFTGHLALKLHPGAIGPITHGEPGLPRARYLDNYYNAHMCFSRESYKHFSRYRREMFRERRVHTPKKVQYPQFETDEIAYFSWRMPNGKRRRLTLVQSRQVFCNIYARKVVRVPAYTAISDMLKAGTNIRIVGYAPCPFDGRPLEQIYLDPAAQIGHEFVLVCLLRGEAPWKTHTFLPNIFKPRPVPREAGEEQASTQ